MELQQGAPEVQEIYETGNNQPMKLSGLKNPLPVLSRNLQVFVGIFKLNPFIWAV